MQQRLRSPQQRGKLPKPTRRSKQTTFQPRKHYIRRNPTQTKPSTNIRLPQGRKRLPQLYLQYRYRRPLRRYYSRSHKQFDFQQDNRLLYRLPKQTNHSQGCLEELKVRLWLCDSATEMFQPCQNTSAKTCKQFYTKRRQGAQNSTKQRGVLCNLQGRQRPRLSPNKTYPTKCHRYHRRPTLTTRSTSHDPHYPISYNGNPSSNRTPKPRRTTPPRRHSFMPKYTIQRTIPRHKQHFPTTKYPGTPNKLYRPRREATTKPSSRRHTRRCQRTNPTMPNKFPQPRRGLSKETYLQQPTQVKRKIYPSKGQKTSLIPYNYRKRQNQKPGRTRSNSI